jgi:hypothetical protein
VGLGRYDDACALFRDRLEEATLFRLAAHRERIAWLERLFPDGAAGLPAVTTGGDQSYALNVLAQSYHSLANQAVRRLFFAGPARSTKAEAKPAACELS